MVCPTGAICFAIPRNHAQKRAWLPAQTTYRTQRRGILLEQLFVQTYCTYGAQASSSSRSCTNLLLRRSRSTAPTGRHVYQKNHPSLFSPRPGGPPCLPKKTIPASFPLVPSGRYVCKRNQTPAFSPVL